MTLSTAWDLAARTMWRIENRTTSECEGGIFRLISSLQISPSSVQPLVTKNLDEIKREWTVMVIVKLDRNIKCYNVGTDEFWEYVAIVISSCLFSVTASAKFRLGQRKTSYYNPLEIFRVVLKWNHLNYSKRKCAISLLFCSCFWSGLICRSERS